MTNNEVTIEWHEAEDAVARASEAERPKALYRLMQAEQYAVERFGPGLHIAAYCARYPEEEDGDGSKG